MSKLRVDLGPVDECTFVCRSPDTDITVGGVWSVATVVGMVLNPDASVTESG